jgi:hypothetical protein
MGGRTQDKNAKRMIRMAKTRCVVMAWSLIILAVVPLAYADGNNTGNFDHRHFDFRNDFGSHRYTRNNTGHNDSAIANVSISSNASIVYSGEKAVENETVTVNIINESVNGSHPVIAAVPITLSNAYIEEAGNYDEPEQIGENQGIVSRGSSQKTDEPVNATDFLQKKGLGPKAAEIQSPPEADSNDPWFSMNLENHSEANESQESIIQDTLAPKAREPLLSRMWHWLSKFGRRD